MSSNPLKTVRAEDFIEYFLFPAKNYNGDETDETEHNLLMKCIDDINEIAKTFCYGYIWHKDQFHVNARYANSNLLIENQSDADDILPSHIYGITHFDENIQDEWFIVALLFELTRQIPGLIARCSDSDGEFLLIESAEFLPKWANPDTCSGRLFILNGELYLLDITKIKSDLTINDALLNLHTNSLEHKVNENIDRCIQKRITSYPQNIAEGLHQTIVYLPISAAALLEHNPSYVASVVRAFCQRDPIDMKVCRAMKYFPPENRVYTNVMFTKCLYAMIMQSNFQPDRKIGWNLPPIGDPMYTAHLLGIKLACGFEILASQAKPSDDIYSSNAWQKYFESLKRRGYFQEYLEHSNGFNRLYNAAKEYFMLHIYSISIAQETGTEILETLNHLDFTVEQFKVKESQLLPADNDSWMNITPEQLDNLLESRYGIKKSYNGNINSLKLTDNVSEFLSKQSDFTGIEVENDHNEIKPIPPKRGIKKTKNKVQIIESHDSSSGTNSPPIGGASNIDFNPDAFQTHVQEMLDLIIPEDNWESNSDMSDFGAEEDEERDDDLCKSIENIESGKCGQIKTSLSQYMDQMDRELARTTIGKSFEKSTTARKYTGDDVDNFDDIENFTPVDIDVNTLKNMADSYRNQFGGPGPAGTLLSSLGIRVKAGECVDDLNVKNS